MEYLDLLIKIAIWLTAYWLAITSYKVGSHIYDFIEHIRGAIIYVKCRKKNDLHHKESPYFKWWRKQELLKGKNPMETSFVCYEMHFVDDQFFW